MEKSFKQLMRLGVNKNDPILGRLILDAEFSELSDEKRISLLSDWIFLLSSISRDISEEPQKS